MIFIWNVAPVVEVAGLVGLGGLAAITVVLNVSDIIRLFDHYKSSSISQSVKGKSRAPKKLVKCFYGRTTSVSNVSLSAGVLSIIFPSYSKDPLVDVLSSIIFIRIIPVIIPQTSCCYRIIVTVF